jgi:hypothetical protein
MTYKQAAQNAIDCQDACNLSGVVFSFARAMQAICDKAFAEGKGTDWKNTHPIVSLYINKLRDLNRYKCDDFPQDEVETIIKQEELREECKP